MPDLAYFKFPLPINLVGCRLQFSMAIAFKIWLGVFSAIIDLPVKEKPMMQNITV